MTQKEKQLLLKDLCARLPYGIMCRIDHDPEGEYDIGIDDERFIDDRIVSVCHENEQIFVHEDEDYPYSPEEIRPYLRPMSSMTEEELNECVCQSGIKDIECPNWQDIPKEKQFEARLNHAIAVFLTDSNNVDWLNAHHFDYRGLIPMGLAIEAPEGMYN